MNIQNKQRIVGIIVLVAFIALLIPFLFTSGPKKAAESWTKVSKVNKNAGEIKSISFTETNQPQITPASQMAAPSDKNIPAPSSVQLPPQTEAATPVTPAPSEAPVTDQQSISLPQNAPVADTAAVPAEPKVELKQPVKETAQPTTKITKPVTKTAKAAPVTKAHKNNVVVTKKNHKVVTHKVVSKKTVKVAKAPAYYVQIGSFADPKRVQRLTNALRAKGFNVYTAKVKTKTGLLTRVLVGKAAHKEDAVKLKQHLATTMNITGTVVKVPK